MKKWAFATSAAPIGLGLSDAEFWYLSYEEMCAKMQCWEDYYRRGNGMYYQLRADIYNSSENLNRTDKQRWTAQDFGAETPKESQRPKPMTREETRIKMLATIGPGEGGSVLKKLKGQALHPSIQAKIDGASRSRAKGRRPIPKNARGEPVPPR